MEAFGNEHLVFIHDFLSEGVMGSLEDKRQEIFERIQIFLLGLDEVEAEVYVSLKYLSHFFSFNEMVVLLIHYGHVRAENGCVDPWTTYHISEGDLIFTLDPKDLPTEKGTTYNEVTPFEDEDQIVILSI